MNHPMKELPSSLKSEHTTGESGRSTRRDGRAGSVRTRRRQNSPLRRQASPVPSKASGTNRLNSPEAKTKPYVNRPGKSKIRTHHGRVESGGAQRGGRHGWDADEFLRPRNKHPRGCPRRVSEGGFKPNPKPFQGRGG